MKSYDEMTQSVLERGDRYFRRKEKRIAAVKKGAPFMSLFGIFTLVGLGLLSSPANDAPTPDTPQQIEIVETQTEVQTVTEIKTVTETAAVSETVNTSSDNENTYFTSTGTTASSPNSPSLPDSPKPAFTTAPSNNSKFTVSAAAVTDIIVKETAAGNITANTNTVTGVNTQTAVKTDTSAVTTVQSEVIRGDDLEFDYMIKSDGTVEIIEPINEPDKYEHFEKLTIPSEIDGRKVTSIGANAFSCLDNLTEVYLPDTVTSIGESAFLSCGSLSDISFPENVKYEYIGGAAFHGTPWLKSKRTEGSFVTVNNVLYDGFNAKGDVVIPSGITYICDIAFTGNLTLKSITLSDDTEFAGAFAFSYCTELESINFGRSIRVIGEGAFANCESLRKIILPQSVERIDPGAFSYTPSLESIYILNPDCAIDDSYGTIDNSTVIYGYSGSTAEAYAKMHDRTFVAIDAEEQKSGTWGSNTSWTLNDTTLTISGNGAIDSISYFANVYHNKFGNAPDKFKEDYPWSEYYDVITDVIIENGITSIPSGAFCYYP
ncbi:MAG: leucine-rich repeat protein, partial [Ruminococcus sp.]